MRRFFQWLSWLWRGKPMNIRSGYHCGCCGKWVWMTFSIRDYEDTWGPTAIGLCEECKGEDSTVQA